MKALFTFLASPSFSAEYLPEGILLDSARIAVAGFSGGAYPARAAALYAQPKPRVVLSVFGMGGDFLGDDWVAEKKGPMMFPGTDEPTDESLRHLIHPESPLAPVSDVPIKAQCAGTLSRRQLFAYSYYKGNVLDYVLGEPVSATLRALPASERLAAVPAHLRPAILEANLDASFPPTCLLHGDMDRAVSPSESWKTYEQLKELGVKTEIHILPDAGHCFMANTTPPAVAHGAEEIQNKGMAFLVKELLGEEHIKM